MKNCGRVCAGILTLIVFVSCNIFFNTKQVTDIALDQTALTLSIGGTETLSYTITPADATDPTVSWSTSDASVANVDDEGTVTAVSAGSAVITVTTTDGGLTDTCTVTVLTEIVPVTGVRLNKDTTSILVGASETLTAEVSPSDATEQSISWASNNTGVATVDGGTVLGISAGTAIITVVTFDGSYEDECVVTVSNVVVPVTGVSLDEDTLTIIKGESGLLSAVISPANATNQNVTWTSSNSSIADVSGGTVTALAAGTATITARTVDGGYADTCTVTVTVPVTGVTLNKESTSLLVGGSETLTAAVIPSDAVNQSVTWSSSNSAVATVTAGAIEALSVGTTTITVTTVEGDHTDTCLVTVSAAPIAVTGVSLNKETTTIARGSSELLTAAISPADATNQNVTWTSSNTSVATVSGGTVTGVAAGTAVITVTTVDGGYTDTCTVTIYIPVTGVALNKDSTTIPKGESETLTATISPSNATIQTAAWTTSDSDVATVTNGIVTAVDVGTAIITVTTTDGGFTDTCTVSVVVPVTGVSLNKDSTTIVKGNTETLTATVSPSDATNKNVTWTTSNSGVATVSGGVVTAVGGGTATITATTADGGYTDSCLVTVTVAVTGVSLNNEYAALEQGQNITLVPTIVPEDADNKNILWSSNNTTVATVSNGIIQAVSDGSATITVRTEDGDFTADCLIYVGSEFITIWNTENTGTSSTNQIKLPLASTGSFDFIVDWGDNSADLITAYNDSDITHTYSEPGIYTLKMTGQMDGWSFNSGGDRLKILSITQWGAFSFYRATAHFASCSNLSVTATDIPDLSNATSFQRAFFSCSSISSIPSIASWDTSTITNLSTMFSGASNFNGDISSWNTALVTNMSSMFSNATSFNCDLSTWNTSKVTTMSSMFSGASNFNGDVSSWNTALVTNMSSMFNNATNFNCDLAVWNTANVTSMAGMFSGASSFNGDVSTWDTSKVTAMESMFRNAVQFNRDLSGWNTALVTNMTYMFYGASQFNGDVSTWDTSKVTDMTSMFQGALAFDGDLSGWDTSNVTKMNQMFNNATVFSGNGLDEWDTSSLTSMTGIFNNASAFDCDLSEWNTSNVTSFASLFYKATSFNGDISAWNTSNVTDMRYLFYQATSFNGDLSGWDVSNVSNMTYLFAGASSFNSDISSWDTSSVTNMTYMFKDATIFNCDISLWDTSNVTDPLSMFENAAAFNQDISGWNTSKMTRGTQMFWNAISFDQDISDWNITGFSDMTAMFLGVTLSPSNYDSILIGWSSQAVKSGVSFNAGDSRYTAGGAAEAARLVLTGTYGWTITDGGAAP